MSDQNIAPSAAIQQINIDHPVLPDSVSQKAQSIVSPDIPPVACFQFPVGTLFHSVRDHVIPSGTTSIISSVPFGVYAGSDVPSVADLSCGLLTCGHYGCVKPKPCLRIHDNLFVLHFFCRTPPPIFLLLFWPTPGPCTDQTLFSVSVFSHATSVPSQLKPRGRSVKSTREKQM